ncbi:MAG: hypothetical protein WBB95_20020, partial [Pseudomonas sp.]|uniref:hypothetical protein n=1 Tax=Pseudomonas sp. TaxID=306 RepID=UPI003C7484BA
LGPLRSPARGKPAHHKSAFHHKNPFHSKNASTTATPFTAGLLPTFHKTFIKPPPASHVQVIALTPPAPTVV